MNQQRRAVASSSPLAAAGYLNVRPNNGHESALKMNWYFVAAAVLAFVVGLLHTVIGEVLIFSRMRRDGLIPTNGAPVLGEGHVRIVWASWHVLTIFGWAMALLLVWVAFEPSAGGSLAVIGQLVAVSMLVGSALVFVGTKARHPGWIGLLGVAVLVWLGRAT